MKKIALKIKGMHCKSCEMLIGEELEDTEAIENISISHKTGILSLDYDEKKISMAKIEQIIKDEGYSVQ